MDGSLCPSSSVWEQLTGRHRRGDMRTAGSGQGRRKGGWHWQRGIACVPGDEPCRHDAYGEDEVTIFHCARRSGGEGTGSAEDIWNASSGAWRYPQRWGICHATTSCPLAMAPFVAVH
jgi:hypothetical protein